MKAFVLCLLTFHVMAKDLAKAKPQDDVFFIKMKEEKIITKDFKFQVEKIIENSLCPPNAHCIWAGEIVFEVKIIHQNMTSNVVLTSNSSSPDGSIIELKDQAVQLSDKRRYTGFKFNKHKVDFLYYTQRKNMDDNTPEGFNFRLVKTQNN